MVQMLVQNKYRQFRTVTTEFETWHATIKRLETVCQLISGTKLMSYKPHNSKH